jgi:hypothetical protein
MFGTPSTKPIAFMGHSIPGVATTGLSNPQSQHHIKVCGPTVECSQAVVAICCKTEIPTRTEYSNHRQIKQYRNDNTPRSETNILERPVRRMATGPTGHILQPSPVSRSVRQTADRYRNLYGRGSRYQRRFPAPLLRHRCSGREGRQAESRTGHHPAASHSRTKSESQTGKI